MTKLLLSLALVLLGIGTASASDAPRAREVFRRLDQNGDRMIQFSEIARARATLFDRFDTNRNGFLEADEVRAAVQQARRRQRQPAAFAGDVAAQARRMDVDRDGRVSRDEFSRFIPDRVRRADVNGDASLSLRELNALRARPSR